MKKILYVVFTSALLLLIINFLLGLFFWFWNKNRIGIEEQYVDAPYVYYKQKDHPDGFKIAPSLSLFKDSGELRIMLLGGSVAYGMGLTQGIQTGMTKSISYFEVQLQKIFPEKKITVINGALPAYVTQQEFIAFQMVLSKYNPDMVIAIHGFNDLESFRLNHHVDDLAFIPSPIFYAGDEFSPALTAVKEYKKEYSISGIADGYFKYIRKGGKYLSRKMRLSNYEHEKTADISNEKIDTYAKTYKKICQDINDYCAIKGFKYANFLQPVRFYNTLDSTYQTYGKQQMKDISPWLSKLYYKMEQHTDSLPYNYSLTNLNKTILAMSDDCHPNEEGYRYMIDEVLKKIVPILKN